MSGAERMPLRLEYHAESAVPVELDGVTPDRLAGRSGAEIERLEVLQGNRRVPLANLFRVAGDPSDGSIDLVGHLRGVHQIGRGMGAGVIRVRGDAGRHLGAGMSGGTIDIEGDAGDWVGCEMQGGVIRVSGSAGDHVGSAYPGSRRGMIDGTILIGGSAGAGCGRSMRRGLLAVGGACGHDVGFGMIAGTILVFGPCGERTGAEMRRGTIGLFGPGPHGLLPTFRPAGRFRPLFFRLIGRELERLGFPVWPGLSVDELTLYHGDLLSLGKGEVWLRDEGVVG
jgi:formylmethanofuran dehydrogenase subunit C